MKDSTKNMRVRLAKQHKKSSRTAAPAEPAKSAPRAELSLSMKKILKDYRELLGLQLSEEAAWERFCEQQKHARPTGDGDFLIEGDSIYVCMSGNQVTKVLPAESGSVAERRHAAASKKEKLARQPEKLPPGFMRMELSLSKTIRQLVLANELLPGLDVPSNTELVGLTLMGSELDLDANLTVSIVSRTK